MTKNDDLDELNALLNERIPHPGEALGLDAKTRKARQHEQTLRSIAATRLTGQAMKRLHPNDWNRLRRAAVIKINQERGPLPGDPPAANLTSEGEEET